MPTQLPAPIPSGIWPGPGDADLTAPLTLPVTAGNPLKTETGITLDDGYSNLTVTGNLVVDGHLNPTPRSQVLAANPPVSGTVYQNQTYGPLLVIIPITATAIGGSAQLALGSTNTPPDWGGAEQIGVVGELHNVQLLVPNNWYWSVTVTSATIGTASVLGL